MAAPERRRYESETHCKEEGISTYTIEKNRKRRKNFCHLLQYHSEHNIGIITETIAKSLKDIVEE